MKLILPRTRCDNSFIYNPLFFLLGPIKGGKSWQVDCCRMLQARIPDCYVAVPCRYLSSHPLYSYRVDSDLDDFPRQLNWERYYLELASRRGCIIAWLPEESRKEPRGDGQPYARDTYGEVGEWRGRLMSNSRIRFVLGAEAGFPGLDVMVRNFRAALSPSFPICSTLDETVACAIQKLHDGS